MEKYRNALHGLQQVHGRQERYSGRVRAAVAVRTVTREFRHIIERRTTGKARYYKYALRRDYSRRLNVTGGHLG